MFLTFFFAREASSSSTNNFQFLFNRPQKQEKNPFQLHLHRAVNRPLAHLFPNHRSKMKWAETSCKSLITFDDEFTSLRANDEQSEDVIWVYAKWWNCEQRIRCLQARHTHYTHSNEVISSFRFVRSGLLSARLKINESHVGREEGRGRERAARRKRWNHRNHFGKEAIQKFVSDRRWNWKFTASSSTLNH